MTHASPPSHHELSTAGPSTPSDAIDIQSDATTLHSTLDGPGEAKEFLGHRENPASPEKDIDEHAPHHRPRGASADVGEGTNGSVSGAKKRKKRPGWKGWALVVEDEAGNVLEYRPRGESPEPGAQDTTSGEGSAAVDPTMRKAKSMSPFVGSRSSGASRQSTVTSPLATSQALEKTTSRDAPLRKRRRGSSARIDTPTASKSPLPQTVSLPESAPSPPLPPTAIPPHVIPAEHPKSSSYPSASSSTPRSRVRTISPGRVGTSQAREDARVAREARNEARSRVSTPILSAVVLPDDAPLPRVPRAGMGEAHPPPPESDVRAEAMFLIEAAERKREENRARRGRDETHSPREAEHRHEWHGDQTPDDDQARRFWKGQNGNGSRANGVSDHDCPSRYGSNGQPSRPMKSHEASQNGHNWADDFEAQFHAIQEDYARRESSYRAAAAAAADEESTPSASNQEAALGRGLNDVRPPKFHDGQRPTVILTSQVKRSRDRFERDHKDGYDGLTPEVVADCDGFVNNVRDNLRNIVVYFLPQPSARRDAFLERVGRGLVDLGWQLTDTGDAAL
ncbi:hypothetical protein BD324DRAFT_613126 [Kockovaella imperatae]|uniref:Uncharacterized protein n=1 Tax=Kockovaella imperatae TaxID=4999 RepID=A0A1Y1UUE9_9TREE|nr:hypothetical protein BD324DRAFT_613126 [Kockovaella imperatae]ORX41086.1 hypothetical protein BD324DRAFT_613126 [Kockovaella imperatae]